jgi:hypothetical protein
VGPCLVRASASFWLTITWTSQRRFVQSSLTIVRLHRQRHVPYMGGEALRLDGGYPSGRSRLQCIRRCLIQGWLKLLRD